MSSITQQQRTCQTNTVFRAVLLCLWTLVLPATGLAGVNDVLLGAADSQTTIDMGTINTSNFLNTFQYNGTSTPSLTIGSNVEAQIGAIFTTGSSGQWYQMRIIIDSNGDGNLDPFDWSDPSHPWNRPDNGTPDNPDDDPLSWDYTYPNDYPRADLRGETITMTWDETNWMVEGFPWDTFEWWWYESGSDKTDNWWMEAGQLMNTWWSGRDQEWNMLPNGNYLVQVWVDENNDGLFESGEAHKNMIIAVQTASITGVIKDTDSNAITRARVEAGSYLAWGEAYSDSNGRFTISGLEAGASYHIRAEADGKVTGEKDVELPEGATSASAGTIRLADAVTITGTIKLDQDANGRTGETADQFQAFTNMWGWEQYDLWVWVDAWNMNGPGWGNADAHFEVGDNAATFTINIPPPSGTATYQLNLNAEGYATSPKTVSVDAGGGNAGTIVLTKASILTGSVRLPAAVEEWKSIDVQAVDVDNSDVRYWGWGQIDPWRDGGPSTDTGEFRIDGIPAGTYDLQVRVMGYATTTVENVVVRQGRNKSVGELAIREGTKIYGTLTITGNTTNLQRWENDDTYGDLDIWIDAWSPSGGWSGTNVTVPRGRNQSVDFSLGGLSDGTYEINSWIGEGYELTDDDGQSPVFVTLSSSNVQQDLVLRQYEGIVTGTISGSGISVDLSKVVVEAKRPWDWMPPKFATVDNGGIDATTGTYTIGGLGTGDYVIKAGLYNGYSDENGQNSNSLDGYNGQGWLNPSTRAGVVTQRVFVQNNAQAPTTLDITLERGYAISGRVTLSSTDRPWHDFGDGTFSNGMPAGDPNGLPDDKADPMLSEYIDSNVDIAGQEVRAMPMEMMFMGGEDPRRGHINPDGSYSIPGLSPGVYMIMPPFNSWRIQQMTSSDSQDQYAMDGEQETHHWTATTQMVVVGDTDVSGIDFELANGHTVSGTLALPEAQVDSYGWDQWVGQLELETRDHMFMGHGRPLFTSDFNSTSRYTFTFYHVANGDYMLRFWTDRYVPGTATFTVANANTSVDLNIETGANLVGKLVDADTGEAVTADDGVQVICEAYPHVEGSYRETLNDDWSSSYIENPDFQNMSGATGEGQRENNTPGKFHLTALPTDHRYVVRVEAEHGRKSGGAKNYIGKVIAGIDIPEGANGDIDVGTIELRQGTTITGRLVDSDGNPIPGVELFAEPSDAHDGSAEAEGISDTNGYYTLFGVDPDVQYYDVIAAERPSMFDEWGKQVEWGEKRKYNVAPGSEDVNFTLVRATASLSGNITIPAGSSFAMPFKDDGFSYPATHILMQRKGVIYSDMLDGIEGMSIPAGEGATTTTYTIDHITPGTYKVIFMNYGLPTQVVDDLVVADGDNTRNVTWESAGHTVSGGLSLATGGYPTSADISGVVCMNTDDQSITFGSLSETADGSYPAYEVPGLAQGTTYQLVFYKESGYDETPEIYTAGVPFTVSGDLADNDAVINRNSEPVLMAQAIQNSDDSTRINLGIFSTAYLVDRSIEVVDQAPTAADTTGMIFVQSGAGSLENVTLSGDKRTIRATYAKASGDDDVTVILAVHYGDEATTKLKTVSFNVNTLAVNSDAINVFLSEQVRLGNGDASQIFIPAGSLDTSDDGKAIITIEKSSEVPGSFDGAALNTVRHLGVFARSAVRALPEESTAAGDQYDFSYTAANTGANASQVGTVTVQIQYDPERVDDIDELQVMHLVGDTWQVEETNRTVDEENHTISADATSLSPFLAAVVRSDGESSGGSSGSSGGGGGGGGSCFIGTLDSQAGNALGILLPVLTLVIFAIIRRHDDKLN